MAKAIFHADFNFSSRLTRAGWSVKASKKPQTWPRELIDAGIAAGVATLPDDNKAKDETPPKESGETAGD